jgi:hypothetical protein
VTGGGNGFAFQNLASFSGVATNTTGPAYTGNFSFPGYQIGISPIASVNPASQTITFNVSGSNASGSGIKLGSAEGSTLSLVISAPEAARVGDAAPTGSVSANPDYITGQLGGSPNFNMLGTPTGSASTFNVTAPVFTAGSGVAAAGFVGPSAAFTASAKTTTAGTFTASQALTLTSGDSANTSTVFNLTPAYGSNPLSLTANIYTPAAATVTPSVDGHGLGRTDRRRLPSEAPPFERLTPEASSRL